MTTDFFANNNEKSRDGVDETVRCIRGNGDGARENAYNNIKYTEQEIGNNEIITGSYYRFATFFVHGDILACRKVVCMEN